MSIGVPIKVLHEAEGHIVTCETRSGEVYRGKLVEAEDNMNCQLSGVAVTQRDGRVHQLESVYIRGSKLRFLILPDMLKNAPMFKRQGAKPGSAGRGKSAILRAQGLNQNLNLNISTLNGPLLSIQKFQYVYIVVYICLQTKYDSYVFKSNRFRMPFDWDCWICHLYLL